MSFPFALLTLHRLYHAKSARFSCRYGPHFCGRKITEDVRKYAAAQAVSEEDAL